VFEAPEVIGVQPWTGALLFLLILPLPLLFPTLFFIPAAVFKFDSDVATHWQSATVSIQAGNKSTAKFHVLNRPKAIVIAQSSARYNSLHTANDALPIPVSQDNLKQPINRPRRENFGFVNVKGSEYSQCLEVGQRLPSNFDMTKYVPCVDLPRVDDLYSLTILSNAWVGSDIQHRLIIGFRNPIRNIERFGGVIRTLFGGIGSFFAGAPDSYGESSVDSKDNQRGNPNPKRYVFVSLFPFLLGSFLISWGWWDAHYGNRAVWKGAAVTFVGFTVNVSAVLIFTSYCC